MTLESGRKVYQEMAARFGIKIPDHQDLKKIEFVVEGGHQDAWRTHFTMVDGQPIPSDSTRLTIFDHYTLTLVGKWTSKGIEPADTDLSSKGSLFEIKGRGEIFIGIQRPRTVITRDGRIFHDLGMFEREWNSDHLASFLHSLWLRYKGWEPTTVDDITKLPVDDPAKLLEAARI